MIDILSTRTPGATWGVINSDEYYSAGVFRCGNSDEDGKREWSVVLTWPGGEYRSRREHGIFAHTTDAREVLSTLASFVGAWDEAQRYEGSENRDLFPAECEPFLTVAEDFSAEASTEF